MSIIVHSSYSRDDILRAVDCPDSVIYFIGIGGISMSALAELMLRCGYSVCGSNIEKNDAAEHLISLGIDISFTHSPERISAIMPTLVVYSLAISSENPEYLAALRLGIMTVSRAELLGALIPFYTHSIGISGSHGKSTGTALLSKILSSAEKFPTVLVGAPAYRGASLLFGKSDYLVYEACEYGDSFLCFAPSIAVILNIELDHTDYFDSLESILNSFAKAASRAESAVVNLDDPNVRSILPRITSRTVTFSSCRSADYTYTVLDLEQGRYRLDIYKDGEHITDLSPLLRGKFNAATVVAAAVAALECGIQPQALREAVSLFPGIPRRLEYRGRHLSSDVFYDYAHHPTEISATRKALEDMGYKSICAVFAPHTYTRTGYFFDSFASELSRFSSALITDIYGARESAVEGISSESLSRAVVRCGSTACTVSSGNVLDIISSLSPDCIVMMGAGDLAEIKKIIEDN
ncbi:MAG: hypothetical protein E7617_05220 [Ruminococcaceae bacterium]|nr:hypothetical protein [Oscillospiraceae bacterium]